MRELAIQHQTDKLQHGFIEVYEKAFAHLKDIPLNILEVGIWHGASLLMWRDYFPNANVYAIDIEDKSHLNGERIITEVCDQSDSEALQNVFPGIEFDIIIDDGSHIMQHQQITLKALLPRLKAGGIFIEEDLHTSLYRSIYTNPGFGYRDVRDYTTLTLLKQIKKPGTFVSDVVSVPEFEALKEQIASIDIHYLNDLESITSVILKK